MAVQPCSIHVNLESLKVHAIIITAVLRILNPVKTETLHPSVVLLIQLTNLRNRKFCREILPERKYERVSDRVHR